MFTIRHLWIVKRGKGSKIMGAVEHSCWNCANIYKLVRRYFASPVSLNQQALLARLSFACFEAFLFVCYDIHRQFQILYDYDFWKTFPNVQDVPIHFSCSIFTTFVQHLIIDQWSTKYWGKTVQNMHFLEIKVEDSQAKFWFSRKSDYLEARASD